MFSCGILSVLWETVRSALATYRVCAVKEFCEIFTPVLMLVFHWSLGVRKFPRVSRILLSLLANFSTTVVGIVSAKKKKKKHCNFFFFFLYIWKYHENAKVEHASYI